MFPPRPVPSRWPMKRRRDATSVLAGRFDVRPRVDPTSTIVALALERDAAHGRIGILGILPNGSSDSLALEAAASASAVQDAAGGAASLKALQHHQAPEPIKPTPPKRSHKKKTLTAPSPSIKPLSATANSRAVPSKARTAGAKPPRPSSTPKGKRGSQASPSHLKIVTRAITPEHSVVCNSSDKRPSVIDQDADESSVDLVETRPSKRARMEDLVPVSPAASGISDTLTDFSLTTLVPRPHSPLSQPWANFRASKHTSPHPSSSTTPSLSPPPRSRSSSTAGKNGARRPAPVKKGWKGWALVDSDEEQDQSRLIRIDQPAVLPKTRQTRSGRKFADPVGDAWEDSSWAS